LVHLRDDFDNTKYLQENQVDLDTFVEVVRLYTKRYWRYNGLFNCQHFATNMYSEFCNRHIDFTSSKLVGMHAFKSGKLPVLDFQIKNTTLDAEFKHNTATTCSDNCATCSSTMCISC